MSKNLSANNKLLVISDTGMYVDENNEVYAFGPVVKEVNHMLTIFDEIIWIGFNTPNKKRNKTFLQISSENVKPILLEKVGGKSILEKLKIVLSYPKMMRVIYKELKLVDKIHTRAPSNPSVIAMFFSLFMKKKTFWHKYAGSWVDKASKFYELQRWVLKQLPKKNNIITVNGDWNQPNNILAFENPCLDEKDRQRGKKIIEQKQLKRKINFCFVGALNEHKGVDKILEAFKNVDVSKVNTLHFVGDGTQRYVYEELSKSLNCNVVFHGFMDKNKIYKIYEITDCILLPSKSEGFPKVIGEAMNYGCIPIVSNVSCIDQYIENGKNGFLINQITPKGINKSIDEVLGTNTKELSKMMLYNYELAEKFTYNYYNDRIKEEVFKLS